MLQVVGRRAIPQQAEAVRTLQHWLDKGAHRIDQEQGRPLRGRGRDPDHGRLVAARGGGRVRAGDGHRALRRDPRRAWGSTTSPNNHGAHLGSAYQDGWYGYVNKDLRKLLGDPVQQPFSRAYCGNGNLAQCRDRAGRLAQGRPRRAEDHALHRQRLHRRRPALLRRGPLPRRSALSRCPRSPGSTGRPSSRSCRSRTTARASRARSVGPGGEDRHLLIVQRGASRTGRSDRRRSRRCSSGVSPGLLDQANRATPFVSTRLEAEPVHAGLKPGGRCQVERHPTRAHPGGHADWNVGATSAPGTLPLPLR